jgi:hypothetical protein
LGPERSSCTELARVGPVCPQLCPGSCPMSLVGRLVGSSVGSWVQPGGRRSGRRGASGRRLSRRSAWVGGLGRAGRSGSRVGWASGLPGFGSRDDLSGLGSMVRVGVTPIVTLFVARRIDGDGGDPVERHPGCRATSPWG